MVSSEIKCTAIK